jgi:hypothetical protein
MELELLKLLPGGGAVLATVVTVILFLKHLAIQNERFDNLVKLSAMREAESRKDYQAHLASAQAAMSENYRLHQAQLQELIGKYVYVSMDTVLAVKNLDTAVRELQGSTIPKGEPRRLPMR